MKKNLLFAFLLLSTASFAQTQFSVTAPNQKDILDGRLLVMLSTNPNREPRFDITDALNTQLVFGIDVENWNTSQAKTVSSFNSFGYPKRYMKDVPAGEYYVQVLLHKYETFHRKD